MLGLPAQTELKKQLPKSAVFGKLMLTSTQREKFDADISRIYIANEISEKTVNIAAGQEINSIFVLHIILKQENVDRDNITILSKMIPQSIVFLLEFESNYKLAVFHTKLLTTQWTSSPMLHLQGLNLDIVWETFVKAIGGIVTSDGNSIEEQISLNEKQEKIQKQIEALEKKLRNTKQFNQQVKIKNEIKKLRGLI